jgi:hypothetical protein
MKKLAVSLGACVLTLGLGAAAMAAHSYGLSDLRGKYAASFSGTILGLGPVSGDGTLISDGNGNLTGGTVTTSDGTNACVETLSGTYTVNPDGTGTMAATYTTSATLHGTCPSSPVTQNSAIVIVSERLVHVSVTDAGVVESGNLTKQHRDFGAD